MILIIGDEHDFHVEHVAKQLRARGREARVLQIGDHAGYRVSVDPARGTGRLVLPDACLESDEITSVWNRRPRPPYRHPEIVDPMDETFVQQEWGLTIDAWLAALGRRVISPMARQRAAVKPLQLRLARSLGLRVPDTLITSDPVEARAFVRSHPHVVHKAMAATKHRFLDTRAWTPEAEGHLDALPLCPTMFQEQMLGPADVRVTFVGRRMFAARVETSAGRAPVDSRLDLDAPCKRHDLPVPLQTVLRELMRRLGLTFGTIDLKILEDGEYAFFEVNPQGQFLYIEILTGLAITDALIEWLGRERRSDELLTPKSDPWVEGGGRSPGRRRNRRPVFVEHP